MRSLLATWQVSLARTRADWPIVAAAWLITVGDGRVEADSERNATFA